MWTSSRRWERKGNGARTRICEPPAVSQQALHRQKALCYATRGWREFFVVGDHMRSDGAGWWRRRWRLHYLCMAVDTTFAVFDANAETILVVGTLATFAYPTTMKPLVLTVRLLDLLACRATWTAAAVAWFSVAQPIQRSSLYAVATWTMLSAELRHVCMLAAVLVARARGACSQQQRRRTRRSSANDARRHSDQHWMRRIL